MEITSGNGSTNRGFLVGHGGVGQASSYPSAEAVKKQNGRNTEYRQAKRRQRRADHHTRHVLRSFHRWPPLKQIQEPEGNLNFESHGGAIQVVRGRNASIISGLLMSGE